ncbi:MAG: hypothetical protein ACI861_001025 [Paracoccaceae bacterium]|jgi:hypothetical protein
MSKFGYLAVSFLAGLVPFLPNTALAQTLNELADICITPTQSIDGLVENLESIGLILSPETPDPVSAAQYFAVTDVVSNVISETDDFDWIGRLSIDAKRLQRTLVTGDTKFKKVRYFSSKTNPGKTILLVLRTNIPNIRYYNECNLVTSAENWSKKTRERLLGGSSNSILRRDGYEGGTILWKMDQKNDLDQYVAAQFVNLGLFDNSIEIKNTPSLTLFSMRASSLTTNNSPKQIEVQQ